MIDVGRTIWECGAKEARVVIAVLGRAQTIQMIFQGVACYCHLLPLLSYLL